MGMPKTGEATKRDIIFPNRRTDSKWEAVAIKCLNSRGFCLLRNLETNPRDCLESGFGIELALASFADQEIDTAAVIPDS